MLPSPSIDRYINGLAITATLSGDAVAYVVVDSLVNGTSSGGVRIAEDLPFPEVKALAREMTLKYSFIGLGRGGAKSGLRTSGRLGPEEKKNILQEFGRKLAPLIRAGIYYPGMDMNCGPDDLKALYRGAGIVLKKTTDTSYFTALSVMNAILACEALKKERRPLTVAIEGFGSVGTYLAERLPAERFLIIALSTAQGAVMHQEGFSAATLLSLRKEFGDALIRSVPAGRPIEKEELLELEVDILVPSARTWSISDRNAGNVRARFIVPVANAPYTERAIDMLHERGVICLPGFVTNAGGVYASSLYDSGVAMEQIEQLSATYYRDIITTLLTRSGELAQSPIKVAEKIACERLRERHERQFQKDNKRDIIKKLFKKRLIPTSVYARQYAESFIENLRKLTQQLQQL